MSLSGVKIPKAILDHPQKGKMVLVCRLLRSSFKTIKELMLLTGLTKNGVASILSKITEQGGEIEKISLTGKVYRAARQGCTYAYKVTKFPGTAVPEMLGPAEVEQFHANRKCRKCQGRLELSRYYECLTCKPELPLDDDYIYVSVENKPSQMERIPV